MNYNSLKRSEEYIGELQRWMKSVSRNNDPPIRNFPINKVSDHILLVSPIMYDSNFQIIHSLSGISGVSTQVLRVGQPVTRPDISMNYLAVYAPDGEHGETVLLEAHRAIYGDFVFIPNPSTLDKFVSKILPNMPCNAFNTRNAKELETALKEYHNPVLIS